MNMNELLNRKPTGRPNVPTLNFVIGDRSCNMSCKYCISKTTLGGASAPQSKSPLWFANKELAFEVAKRYNTDTVLITSKGEPTLWMQDVLHIISESRRHNFIVELQTNGAILDENMFDALASCGLNTIAISRASIERDANNSICAPTRENSPDLYTLAHYSRKYNVNMRLCLIAMKNNFDTFKSICGVCLWAAGHNISQVTIRRMGMPDINNAENDARAKSILQFVAENMISDKTWKDIIDTFMKEHAVLRIFDWGSISWTVFGTQLLIADCLTTPGLDGVIRYLLYCNDGHLRYSWEHDCAILF